MARKRSKSRGMIFIQIDATVTLSTLAAGAIITGTVLTFGEDFFMVGMKASWSLRDGTDGEMPILAGFAHGDLSVTEIGEWQTAEVTDPDDIIANERTRRPCRKVGVFGESARTDQALNDGAPLLTRFKRSIGDGHALNLWAMNQSSATLTTGTQVKATGHIYGRWQR